MISKYFRRQNTKFKIQKKTQWMKSVVFQGNKLKVDWFLGGKRYLKFLATDVKTLDTREPWSKLKNGSMKYSCSTLCVTHLKHKKIEKNPYEIDLSQDGDQPNELEKLEDDIIKIRDFSFTMRKTAKIMQLIFESVDLDIDVPNHLHFGALIKAMMKQIRFQIRWHKLSYKEYKMKNRIKLPPRPMQAKATPRDFNLIIKTDQFSCKGEDNPLSKCLIYQNEIVSSLKEMELTHCNQKILYNFRRRLILNKVQEDYTSINCTNLEFNLVKPRKYQDKNYCISMIRELDEARQYVTPDIFDYINANDFTVSCEDLQWSLRNLKKPFLQMKDARLSSLIIEALLNHGDDSEFILNYPEKIYEKYVLPNKLRKLLPK